MDSKELINWMESQGSYLSQKVSIENDREYNYYMIAKEKMEKDEVMFTVPWTLILSIHNSEICDKLLEEKVLQNSRLGGIVMCIFHELFLAERSRWFIYFKMFPHFDNHSLPILWTDDKMKWLKGTGVEDSVNNTKESLIKDYETIVLPFITKYQQFFQKGITLEKFMFYAAFVIAYYFQKTEVGDDNLVDINFTSKNTYYIVPIADILSHASRFNAKMKYETSKVMMVAEKTIMPGERLEIKYGDFPNTTLLEEYGFTLPFNENDDDCVEIDVYGILRSQYRTKMAERMDFMKNLGRVSLNRDGFRNVNAWIPILTDVNKDQDASLDLAANPNYSEEQTSIHANVIICDFYNMETLKNIPKSVREFLKTCIVDKIQEKRMALDNLSKEKGSMEINSIFFVKRLLEGHLNLLENILKYI